MEATTRTIRCDGREFVSEDVTDDAGGDLE